MLRSDRKFDEYVYETNKAFLFNSIDNFIADIVNKTDSEKVNFIQCAISNNEGQFQQRSHCTGVYSEKIFSKEINGVQQKREWLLSKTTSSFVHIVSVSRHGARMNCLQQA